MDAQEYKAWSDYMKLCRGWWTLDPIHDGINAHDLLVFFANPVHPDEGVYISVSRTGLVDAGKFDSAVPHIGDAVFTSFWQKQYPSFIDAAAVVLERTGVKPQLSQK